MLYRATWPDSILTFEVIFLQRMFCFLLQVMLFNVHGCTDCKYLNKQSHTLRQACLSSPHSLYDSQSATVNMLLLLNYCQTGVCVNFSFFQLVQKKATISKRTHFQQHLSSIQSIFVLTLRLSAQSTYSCSVGRRQLLRCSICSSVSL